MVTEVCRKNGRKVLSWFSWQMEELRKTDEGGFTLVELLAVTEFSEVRTGLWSVPSLQWIIVEW